MTIPARPIKKTKKQSGSALLWVLVWLVGLAAIAFFCVIRHVPTLELATEGRINQALSAASATGVTAKVNGYAATLTGTVQNETQKRGFLALAAGTPGVKSVVDELQVSDIAVATAGDDTPIVGKTIKLDSETGSSALSETATSSDTSATIDATAAVAVADTITTDETDTAVDATDAESAEVAQTLEDESANPGDTSVSDTSNTDETKSAPTAVDEAEVTEDTQEKPADPIVATVDPTLTLDIDEGTLLVDGQFAKTDDLNLLVDQAKASLNVDFVSDSTQADDNTKPATWLEPITALVPAMAPLEAPGISIVKNQITLTGLAPDQAAHDAIINRALQLLGEYALVERIDIVASEPETIEKLSESIDETIAEVEQSTQAAKTSNATESTAAESAAEPTVTPTPEPTVKPAVDTVADSQPQVSTESTETSLDPGVDIRRAFELLPTSKILFRSGSSILTTESQDVLDSIAQLLRQFPDAKMDIDGHTDAQGDSNVNLQLSQLRANAVRDYLVDQGISVYRLTAYGFGEGMPIATNDNPEGRALNRRIEFKF